MLLHRLFDNRLQIASGTIESLVAQHVAESFRLLDVPPAEQERKRREFIESWPYAPHLLRLPHPPLQTLEEAALSPMARAFYAENRRVANGKAKRALGWRPRHPTYREGLRAILAAEQSEQAS